MELLAKKRLLPPQVSACHPDWCAMATTIRCNSSFFKTEFHSSRPEQQLAAPVFPACFSFTSAFSYTSNDSALR
jgi:hypothetical protein